MKKQFIIPVIGFLFASCNSDAPTPVEDSGAPITTIENIRTETEAVEIATRSLNEFYPTEARSSRDLSNMNVVLLQDNASRNTETTNPLYVVNFGDDNGYAIISANKDVDPLLAITESGTISSLDDIDNPGLKIFVNGAMKLQKDTTAIVPTPGSGIFDEQELDVYRNDTVYHVNQTVFNRIRVRWGQTYPEGSLCPNGISGCVATAGAQALSFFKYPEEIDLTFPGHTSENISLNWGLMNRLFLTGTTKPEEYNIQLSTLCREIGHKIDSDYSSRYCTLANIGKLRNYFANLLPKEKYAVLSMKESAPDTHKKLGNGLIIMSGNVEDEQIGHCWVIDGYRYMEYTVYVYKHKINSANETLERQFDKIEQYSDINWGWYGKDNGYFNMNSLITSQGHYKEAFYYFTINTK